MKKKDMNIGSNKDINPNLPLSNVPEVTINYIFQRPSGSWSAQQELASNVIVNPPGEVNNLYWKKVTAFYLKEKGGDERRIVISIGNIEPGNKASSNLFAMDEDLVVNKEKLEYFFDAIHKDDLNKNIKRANISEAVVGDRMILFGGKEYNQYSKEVEIYDNTTGRWSAYEASEARAYSTSVAVVGNKALFFGGDKAVDNSNPPDPIPLKRDEYIHCPKRLISIIVLTIVGQNILIVK